MNRVTLQAGNAPVTATCGHSVLAHAYFFAIVGDAQAYVAGAAMPTDVMKTACSPDCADQLEARLEKREPGRCCWRGCEEEGTPRNIHLSLPAPRIGGGASVLVTFSDDVPLCDEHDQSTRRMIEDLIHEEMGGADVG